jgi:hypothetical protein
MYVTECFFTFANFFRNEFRPYSRVVKSKPQVQFVTEYLDFSIKIKLNNCLLQ